MYKRIKKIRQVLGLSQREFGEKLGVSRDVISNIEYNRVEPKEVFIKHLCKTYNVNREWIEFDQGEMFTEHIPYRKIDEAVNLFKELSPDLQDYALEQIKGLLKIQNSIKNTQ